MRFIRVKVNGPDQTSPLLSGMVPSSGAAHGSPSAATHNRASEPTRHPDLVRRACRALRAPIVEAIAVTAIAPSLLAPAAGAPPAAARWCQREHEEKARLGFSSAEQEFVQGVCSTNCARLVGGWSRPRRNSTRAARTVAQDVLAPSRGSPCSLTSTAPVYLRPGRIRCALAPLHRAARTRVTARAPAPTRVDLLPTVSTFLPHRSLGGFSSLHLQCTSSLAQLRAGHRQADAPLAQSGTRVRATGTVP
jgi:hypothetical protein